MVLLLGPTGWRFRLSEVSLFGPRTTLRAVYDLMFMGRLGQDKPAFGWELEPL